MQAHHLVLVGMPGSGKSSVGRRVARHTGRRCIDLDTEIERSEGRSIPEIFAAEGEAGFREIEAATLRTVLDDPEPAVIATGGGAVLHPDNRAAMRARGIVVWLRADPATLAARVGDGSSRPLLVGDPRARLAQLAVERSDSYAAAAHEIVDVDDQPFDAITERVLAAAQIEVGT